MEALFALIARVKALDEDQLFTEAMDIPGARQLVLDLNRYEQLYRQGVDSNGVPIGYYRPYTLEVKRDPMLDHITLKETGEFYDSFRLNVGNGYMEITADTMKGADDLEAKHGPILGLTEESKEELAKHILENGFSEIVKEKILQS